MGASNYKSTIVGTVYNMYNMKKNKAPGKDSLTDQEPPGAV